MASTAAASPATTLSVLLDALKYFKEVSAKGQFEKSMSSSATVEDEKSLAERIKSFGSAKQLPSQFEEINNKIIESGQASDNNTSQILDLLQNINANIVSIQSDIDSTNVIDKLTNDLGMLDNWINQIRNLYERNVARLKVDKRQTENTIKQKAWSITVNEFPSIVSQFANPDELKSWLTSSFTATGRYYGDSYSSVIKQTVANNLINMSSRDNNSNTWKTIKDRYRQIFNLLQSGLSNVSSIGKNLAVSADFDDAQKGILKQAFSNLSLSTLMLPSTLANIERVVGGGTYQSSSSSGAFTGTYTSKPSKILATAKNVMVREIDGDIVETCRSDLDSFSNSLDKVLERLAEPVVQSYAKSLASLQARLEENVQKQNTSDTAEASKVSLDFRQLQEGKHDLVLSFLAELKSIVLAPHYRLHAKFLNEHRRCIKYMNTWRDVPFTALLRYEEKMRKKAEVDQMMQDVADSAAVSSDQQQPDAKKMQDDAKKRVALIAKEIEQKRKDLKKNIDKYFEVLEKVKLKVSDFYKTVDKKYLKDASLVNLKFLEEDHRRSIVSAVKNLEDRIESNHRVLMKKYSNGYGALDELVKRDSIVLYATKAIRIPLFWTAAKLATRAFEAMYSRRVYSASDNPPHPVIFLSFLIGIDLLLNVLVYTVLSTASYLFNTEDDDFLIGSVVLKDFTWDYLLVTGILFVVCAIAAVLIYHKKYFRYKFEGKRGIAALESIAKAIFLILLPIPFFLFAR